MCVTDNPEALNPKPLHRRSGRSTMSLREMFGRA